PASHRGRAIRRFYCAGPLAAAVMGAMSAWLLQLDGLVDLRGWQWLFLVQGLPAVVLGLVFLAKLPETPAAAAWLSAEERAWIASALERDSARVACRPSTAWSRRSAIPWCYGLERSAS